MELFRTCEDLEKDEGLHLMFMIVKGISKLMCYPTWTLIPNFILIF